MPEVHTARHFSGVVMRYDFLIGPIVVPVRYVDDETIKPPLHVK